VSTCGSFSHRPQKQKQKQKRTRKRKNKGIKATAKKRSEADGDFIKAAVPETLKRQRSLKLRKGSGA
jgi:hypothetical protein